MLTTTSGFKSIVKLANQSARSLLCSKCACWSGTIKYVLLNHFFLFRLRFLVGTTHPRLGASRYSNILYTTLGSRKRPTARLLHQMHKRPLISPETWSWSTQGLTVSLQSRVQMGQYPLSNSSY